MAQRPIPSFSQCPFGQQLLPDTGLPEQFHAPVTRWRTGVFIPGVRPRYLRSPGYPARIYLLTDDSLIVVAEPLANEAPLIVSLADVREIESRKAELHGELCLWTCGYAGSFRYSPLQQRCMTAFLRVLYRRWLEQVNAERRWAAGVESEPIGLRGSRLCYALQSELAINEKHLKSLHLLQPNGSLSRFPGHPAARGDLFVLTDLRFSLASEKKDRIGRPAGIVSRSRSNLDMGFWEFKETAGRSCHVSIRFDDGRAWNLPVAGDQTCQVRDFLQALRSFDLLHARDLSSPRFCQARESIESV